MNKVKGAPDKIGVEWYYVFPDEGIPKMELGCFSPLTDNCLEGDPKDVYHRIYPMDSCEFVLMLCTQITAAYDAGILNTNLTCREYFFKHLPDFIEVVDYRK